MDFARVSCGMELNSYQSGSLTNSTMNDVGEAVAWRFSIPAVETITDIGIRIGTKQGTGGVYRVGLQSADANYKPSGTWLESGNCYGSLDVSSTGWKETTLGTSHTTTAGERLLVVVEAVTGTTSSNYVTASHLWSSASSHGDWLLGGWNRNLGSGYSFWQPKGSCYSLVCSSGKVYGSPVSAAGTQTNSAGDANDITGNKFTLANDLTIYGLEMSFGKFSSGTFDYGIWTTATPPVEVGVLSAVDHEEFGNDQYPLGLAFESGLSLTGGTEYIAGIKQLSTNDLEYLAFNVNSNADMDAFWPGTGCYFSKYDNSGSSYSDTTTRRIPMAFWVDEDEVTSSGGGGGGSPAWGMHNIESGIAQ